MNCCRFLKENLRKEGRNEGNKSGAIRRCITFHMKILVQYNQTSLNIRHSCHYRPICMMTIACLLMLIIHMIQDMQRSEKPGLPSLFPFISKFSTRHCTADNPKVVTVNVTDILSTHDNVMCF